MGYLTIVLLGSRLLFGEVSKRICNLKFAEGFGGILESSISSQQTHTQKMQQNLVADV